MSLGGDPSRKAERLVLMLAALIQADAPFASNLDKLTRYKAALDRAVPLLPMGECPARDVAKIVGEFLAILVRFPLNKAGYADELGFQRVELRQALRHALIQASFADLSELALVDAQDQAEDEAAA